MRGEEEWVVERVGEEINENMNGMSGFMNKVGDNLGKG